MQSENDSSEFSDLLDSEGVCKLYQVSMNGQFQSRIERTAWYRYRQYFFVAATL